jgi:hypothetical protein
VTSARQSSNNCTLSNTTLACSTNSSTTSYEVSPNASGSADVSVNAAASPLAGSGRSRQLRYPALIAVAAKAGQR